MGWSSRTGFARLSRDGRLVMVRTHARPVGEGQQAIIREGEGICVWAQRRSPKETWRLVGDDPKPVWLTDEPAFGTLQDACMYVAAMEAERSMTEALQQQA